jgi:hypothetical protein
MEAFVAFGVQQPPHPMGETAYTTWKNLSGGDASQLQQSYLALPLIHSRNAASTPQILRLQNNILPTPCAHVDQQSAYTLRTR